jgi:hypothetical protein
VDITAHDLADACASVEWLFGSQQLVDEVARDDELWA